MCKQVSFFFISVFTGHFLLTYLLMDKLKSSAPSRIIIVSSRIHTQGSINFKDLNSAKNYNKVDAYAQSKLANLLHQKELAKHLEGKILMFYLFFFFDLTDSFDLFLPDVKLSSCSFSHVKNNFYLKI